MPSRLGVPKSPFTPLDSINIHNTAAKWLAELLAMPLGGKTVVVIHLVPSWLPVAERYKEAPLSSAFCSRLEQLKKNDGPGVWIYAHTLDALGYEIYNTRVVCKPRRYSGEDGLYGIQRNLTVSLN